MQSFFYRLYVHCKLYSKTCNVGKFVLADRNVNTEMNCSCNSVITKPQPLNCLVLKKKNAFQFMIKSVNRYNTIQYSDVNLVVSYFIYNLSCKVDIRQIVDILDLVQLKM